MSLPEPYYQDDFCTIYHGDCREVMPALMPVHAIVTDPPYMDYYSGHYDGRPNPHMAITEVLPTEYLPLCYNLMIHPGAMILWCRWDVFPSHSLIAGQAGYMVKNMIVWAKPNHTAGDLQGNLANQHECAIFAVTGPWKRHGKRDTNLGKEPNYFSKAWRPHPNAKPESLMKRSCEWSCPEGGRILDPFMGSGTTLRAAKDCRRISIGIEIEEKYCEIAANRLRQEVLW